MQSITLPDRSTTGISIGLVAVLLATVALSWPALTGPFLFDDFPNLQHLAELQGKLDWRSLAHYMSLFAGDPGRPLSMLSFVINDFAWPSEPFGFKYTNLLLHLLVGTLIFGFSRALAHLHTDRASADLTALLAVAAWLLHPMQLSTSMLVVQRMTQLSALFAVAGLWAYVSIGIRARSSIHAVLAIAALGMGTALSLLCKENGALTPLLAVVMNATLLRRRLNQTDASPRRILILGAALPVILLLIAIAVRWDALTWYGTRDFNMFERALSEPRALCDYLYRIVIPNLRGGGIYHDDFAVSKGLLSPWTTLPSLLLILGSAGVALVMRHRWPLFAFAVLWYLAGHLLESTVFPLELYFEHRNYLPMFGIVFPLAMVAATSASRRKLVLVFAVFWLAYAAFLTSVQGRVWGSRATLANVWAIEHPASARAIQQQADYLASSGHPVEATNLLMHAYRRGVRGSAFPLQAYALACTTGNANFGRFDALLLNAASDPYEPATLATVSSLRLDAESRTCPDLLDESAWLDITSRLLNNPHYGGGDTQAYLHVERSYLFRARRDLNATMRELEAAWAVDPNPSLARLIAATLASAGLFDEAEAWAKRSSARQPAGLRGLLSGDDERGDRLLQAIRKLRRTSQ